MKTKKIIPIFTTTVLLCSLLFIGCKQASTEETIPENESVSTPETSAEPEPTTETVDDSEKIKTITIAVYNSSDINVGMFSVIDPVTNEQINLDSLESGSKVSMECNWPIDTSEFHWALYNESGELCIDSSTDISNVQKAVAIILSGKDTIENVETITE